MRAVAGALLLCASTLACAFGTVGSCPADFAALRATAEQVRNPTVRASALDLAARNVGVAVFRAGGLERFLARQRELIEEWRAFPLDQFFESDRRTMIALYEGMIDIAGCVHRKGDPRQRVDVRADGNRELAAVVAVLARARDEQQAVGSGVLVSPCHVLTSQHVVFGNAAPKLQHPATVMLGEVRTPRVDFAERIDARVVGYSRLYWPETSIDNDWALLRLARRVDTDYPSLPLLPRGETSPDRQAFVAGARDLTVAGFPGEKLIEGGSPSALWRHAGCHTLAIDSPIGGWSTTCAMNPGQSGGPVITPRAAEDEGGKARWELVGLAAAMSAATRGIVRPGETDVARANLITPLVGETLEEIYQLIDTYSCGQ